MWFIHKNDQQSLLHHSRQLPNTLIHVLCDKNAILYEEDQTALDASVAIAAKYYFEKFV